MVFVAKFIRVRNTRQERPIYQVEMDNFHYDMGAPPEHPVVTFPKFAPDGRPLEPSPLVQVAQRLKNRLQARPDRGVLHVGQAFLKAL